MPNLAYYAAAVAVSAVAVVNLLRVGESLSDRMWSLWGELLGLFGVVFLTQVVATTQIVTPHLPWRALPYCSHRQIHKLRGLSGLLVKYVRWQVQLKWISSGKGSQHLPSETVVHDLKTHSAPGI